MGTSGIQKKGLLNPVHKSTQCADHNCSSHPPRQSSVKMIPPLDDRVLQERNLHERYQLSDDVLDLFRAYGEHHRGVEPPEALGRRLRTSMHMRTCTYTISSLALAMQKNPTPECMAECNEIIACCTQMLNIASESESDPPLSPHPPKYTHSFPFTCFRGF